VAVAATPAAAVPEAAEAPSAFDGGSRPRVLVVEDSPTVSSVVKYFLELEGFEVLLAADGEIGLETARRELPRVIVSDVSMPRMSGIEMVRALREDAATANIRILMLTSEASVESETDGLAAGADDYILKPVEPRRLSARVKALLARARPGQAA
jgi:two-component system alkaline phosphatase synthesis response regulator PhoP